MPNTIAHFAVAGLLTRCLIKTPDLKWVLAGCVLPDIPWIMQRLVRSLNLTINMYDVRAYAIAQSSLILCLVLACGFAVIAKDSLRVFLILAFGSLVHLLLDATQIKWANGVLLMAPFHWHMFRLDWYWPDSIGTYALTFSGFCYFLYGFIGSPTVTHNEFRINGYRWVAGGSAIAIWMLLPFFWIDNVYGNDHHFISTLSNVSEREKKLVEFDRIRLSNTLGNLSQVAAYSETISLNESVANHGDVVSVRGRFMNSTSVEVSDIHVHSSFRDKATYAGLSFVLLTWLIFFVKMCRGWPIRKNKSH